METSKRVGLGLLAVAMLVVVGCGSKPSPAVRTEMVPFTPEQKQELERAQNTQYRLRAGDRLAVDFKYEDTLDSAALLVLPDGSLTLPGGVDPVPVRGLTVSQVDSLLTATYAVDYRYPDLSVMVEDLADLPVYVFGYVQNPGQIVLPPEGMGVMQAIASAGGFDEHAKSRETVVLRATPEGFMLRQIDLTHIQRRGIPDLAALDLRPYDIIYVPRSAIGDFDYFSRSVLEGLVNVTQIFWDIYGIANLDKVGTIYR